MDFYTDPEMSGTAPITNIPSKIELKTDDKTEERFDKLETSIEKSFNVLTNHTTEGVSKLMENPLLKNISSNTTKHFNEQLSNLAKNLNLNDSKEQEAQKDSTAADSENTEEKTSAVATSSPFNFFFQKIGKVANDYLNDLDNELEQVENVSMEYANKMGSFIKSNMIERITTEDNLRDFKITQANRGELNEDESKLLYNYVPELSKDEDDTKVFLTRTEAEISYLETQSEYYLKDLSDDPDFKIADCESDKDKFDEISKLLKEKKNLQKLMADLVPSKISFNEFWSKYFYQHDKILKKEQERKKMLQEGKQKKGGEEEDEDFKWDDDDEENVDDDEE